MAIGVRMPSQASRVQATPTTSRLAAAARPAVTRGDPDPGARTGPHASPGRTKRRARTSAAWVSCTPVASGSEARVKCLRCGR